MRVKSTPRRESAMLMLRQALPPENNTMRGRSTGNAASLPLVAMPYTRSPCSSR
jgi:hypothetical protein